MNLSSTASRAQRRCRRIRRDTRSAGTSSAGAAAGIRDPLDCSRPRGEIGCSFAADDQYAPGDSPNARWLGDDVPFPDAGEAAFRCYLDDGRAPRAAIVALDMAAMHFPAGGQSLGSGWLSRTQRPVERE